MKKIVWVITEAYNDYDQHGEYLVAVFTTFPTKADLIHIFPDISDEAYEYLSKGGGRKDTEDSWYYLTELEVGKEYIHYEK